MKAPLNSSVMRFIDFITSAISSSESIANRNSRSPKAIFAVPERSFLIPLDNTRLIQNPLMKTRKNIIAMQPISNALAVLFREARTLSRRSIGEKRSQGANRRR